MAAPSPSARIDPVGIKLDDGYRCLIALAADLDVSFWEKTVQPPGVDGGDSIEQTTMHNDDWRTMSARALKTLTESSATVAYDPNVYNNILALINVETTVTIHFPDGSTLAFYGYLQKFEPSELQEGEQPEASITIVPTNFDPAAKVEAAPVLTSVAGT